MPRKLALLVGVDSYAHFPAHQLVCCKNDAQLMAGVLCERFGFVEEDITLLLDKAATLEGIRAGLEHLRIEARPGDSVVFYFSGHGSQVPDVDGDEPDGKDETIVPHDSGRGSDPVRDLVDDEIYEWILALNAVTPYLTIIADTCCSGTLTRQGRAKWIEPADRPPEGWPRVRSSRIGKRPKREDGPAGFFPIDERFAFLAACHRDESAKEMREHEPPYSAFTFHLCQELLRAPANATYRDVHERIRWAVSARFHQTPQLEGARDRLLFGGARTAPERHLLVAARDGQRILLGGGALHGVAAGSQWSVYPPGTRSPKGAKPLGVVQVVRPSGVRAVSSDAEILREKGTIEPGARAFETSKGEGAACLTVALESEGIDPAARILLTRRIERSPALRLVENTAEAELKVRIEELHWAVLDRGGELALPLILRTERGAVERLAADLETRARFLEILRCEAEAEDNPLHGCLDVQLLRRSEDGKTRPAKPDRRLGEVIYRPGELLAFRIVHRAAKPLHIHVLDLGLTGAVTPLYPIPGTNDPIDPEWTLELGCDRKLRIQQLPELFVDWSKARGQKEPQGREILKVIATTHSTDLSGLRQLGYGATPGNRQTRRGKASLLSQILGRRMRDSTPSVSDGEGEEMWTVVTCGFLVRGG